MKIEIDGRQIEVDNNFNSLTPEQQQATVEEIYGSFQMEAEAKTKIAEQSAKQNAPAGTFDLTNSQSGIRKYGVDPALAIGTGALSSVLDTGNSVKNFVVEHPIESYGLYKAGQYAWNKLKPSGPVSPITATGVSYTPEAGSTSTKIPVTTAPATTAPATTAPATTAPATTSQILGANGRPIVSAPQMAPAALQAPPGDQFSKTMQNADRVLRSGAPQMASQAPMAPPMAPAPQQPGMLNRMVSAAAPYARTAARVAGPAGILYEGLQPGTVNAGEQQQLAQMQSPESVAETQRNRQAIAMAGRQPTSAADLDQMIRAAAAKRALMMGQQGR